MIDMETMDLYKKMPINGYKDNGYNQEEFCSNCGQNEYEDVLRNIIATRKRKTKNYEKHCPSCHCPTERQRFSPSCKSRTAGNIEAVLNRYERSSPEPINSTIKKTQSSPLSQKVCWNGCQTSAHPRCPKRSLQNRRQRRTEIDRCPFRVKGDAVNSELTNEDIEAYKYMQQIPIKSSLKKHGHCREPEGSPNEQEYSDADSEVSTKHTSHIRQSRKSRVPNLGSRHHCVGGDAEYVAEMRNESDVELRQNDCRGRDCQEARKIVLEFENLERLKRGEGEAAMMMMMMSEDDKRTGKRKRDVARTTKQGKLSNAIPYRVTNKPSMLIKESVDEPKELALNASAHLAKLDLRTTKTRILESIDHVLGTMDDTKNNAPMQQQEQTEQETVEKISRELQENGWQFLFNALTIHRNSTDSSRRTVRLECLNHIRQQLDKLYALESTLDNCPPKLQSSYDTSYIEENQQQLQQRSLEQKIVDS